MRVLLFRPQPDAERTAQALRARGHDPVVAPLFTIVPGAEPAPEGPFDALILTSANAAPALAKTSTEWRGNLRAFCIGERTARAAGELGFTISTAGGGRADLAKLVLDTLPPGQKLLFAAGRDRHEDLPAQLRDAGYEVTVWTAYEAQALPELSEAARAALREGSADAALHYSPRGTQTFLDRAAKAGFAAEALALPHVALSAEVAGPLISAGADTVLVAEHPEEAALFAALDHVPARILLNDDAKTEPAAREPASPTDRDAMNEPDSKTEQGATGKRRGRSGRVPPTIELTATPGSDAVAAEPKAEEPAAQEATPEEPKPADIRPEEPSEQAPPATDLPPAADLSDDRRPAATLVTPEAAPAPARSGFSLPTVALAGLLGGAVGAGIVLLALRNAGADTATQIADLGQRIETLQAAGAGLPNRAAFEALDRKASAATEAAAKAGTEAQAAAARIAQLAGAARTAPADAAAMNTAVQRAESDAQAARETAAALARRMDEAGQRLNLVETATKNALIPGRQAAAAARVVLSERIRNAIATGRPFQAEVAALASGGMPADQLAALNAVAEKGAATREALLAQFRSHRALFAQETAPAATSWESKLLGLASRVVTVRPVGDSGANDPATLPIRLENALAQNEIGKAAELWAQLPEPARRPSEALGAALKARAAAESTIARITQDAVAALGAAG